MVISVKKSIVVCTWLGERYLSPNDRVQFLVTDQKRLENTVFIGYLGDNDVILFIEVAADMLEVYCIAAV